MLAISRCRIKSQARFAFAVFTPTTVYRRGIYTEVGPPKFRGGLDVRACSKAEPVAHLDVTGGSAERFHWNKKKDN